MTASIKSKHSTESGTAIKKTSRWFRTVTHHGDMDQIFDLYWGGEERRITKLTLKIMGVNVIAVIALIFGVVYLSQYNTTLVSSKLEHFETELKLVTAAITEGALKKRGGGKEEVTYLSRPDAQILSARLAATLDKRILIFNKNEEMISDTELFIEKNNVKPIFQVVKDKERKLESVEIIKDTAAWIISFLPSHNILLPFQGIESKSAEDYLDAMEAYKRKLSMTAWRSNGSKKGLMLTAAMPILDQSRNVTGVVMMVSDGSDINEALGDAWFNILKIFLLTLFITILLSIYLSGVIARPLRKLALAAENVRKGKLKHTEIPDMSDRKDEIGELSIVLRDMTNALWDRMDTIESFAADVSHEIKNPLTSLKSAVETAIIVKKKEDLDKLLDIIRHDIERLDRLISDISNASKLDAELSREMFDRIDLKMLLRNLLDSYKSPLERETENDSNSDEALKDGILITLDMADHSDIYIRGSEGRLIQVFQNIISNAISFSPIKTSIKILVTLRGNRVTITIEDEGPGIPENQLENIFERFYSERPEHEKYGQHSGLGLSICKQIVTAHNGIIYAENKKDREGNVTGARFVIILNTVQ